MSINTGNDSRTLELCGLNYPYFLKTMETSTPACTATRDFNSACKRCNFIKSDAIICDAGAKSTNYPVEVMQNAAKIS